MTDSVRKADYFYVEVANQAGAGAMYLKTLRDAGVNLLAFTGFPAGRKAQIDFIPEDTAAFRAEAKKNKWKLSARKTVFLVQGDDRPGAIHEVIGKLAAAKISMTALDAVTAGAGRYGAMFWVKPGDVAKAARILGAI
jgi:prephenate dehydratase